MLQCFNHLSTGPNTSGAARTYRQTITLITLVRDSLYPVRRTTDELREELRGFNETLLVVGSFRKDTACCNMNGCCIQAGLLSEIHN